MIEEEKKRKEDEDWEMTPENIKESLANLLVVDVGKVITQTYYLSDLEMPQGEYSEKVMAAARQLSMARGVQNPSEEDIKLAALDIEIDMGNWEEVCEGQSESEESDEVNEEDLLDALD